jgi:hypothetical protein
MHHSVPAAELVSSQNDVSAEETGKLEPPHCDTGSPASDAPHCDDYGALDGLVRSWVRAALKTASAKELALEFRRAMQAHTSLIGKWLRSEWIRRNYPSFCAALGVSDPPPYKDFAFELAKLMPRKRTWQRCAGGVDAYTAYRVPDPADAVVVLADEKRKRG